MPVGVSSENAWLSLDFEKIGLGQLPQHLTTVKIYTPGGHDMKFFFRLKNARGAERAPRIMLILVQIECFRENFFFGKKLNFLTC